jgi:hypothetical protein
VGLVSAAFAVDVRDSAVQFPAREAYPGWTEFLYIVLRAALATVAAYRVRAAYTLRLARLRIKHFCPCGRGSLTTSTRILQYPG